MTVMTRCSRIRLVAGLTTCAIVLCAVSIVPARAAALTVLVERTVKTADLDLNRAADVRELYRRLRNATQVVCGQSARVGLDPPASTSVCREAALARAVRSLNWPQLTLEYLANHSLGEAVSYGIAIPVQVANRK